MRILVTSPHCRPDWINKLGLESQGGQTVVMNELYRVMAKICPDVFVDIYTRFQDNDPFAKQKIKNLGHRRVRLIRLPAGSTDRYIPKEELYGKYINEFVRNIISFSKEEGVKYDLLHGHYADGWETVRKCAKLFKVPYVLTTHSLGRSKRRDCLERGEDTEEALDKKYHFPERIESEEKSLTGCRKLFPLSSFEKEFILKHYQAMEHRADDILPIPNGIEVKTFAKKISREEKKKRRKRMGVKPDDFMILIPSRIDERKGQLNAVEALVKLRSEAQNKIKLVLLCWPEKIEGYACVVQNLISKKELESQIIKIPPVPRQRMFRMFGSADAVLLPSQEYFSMVMIEAMYSRLPVIASKFSGAVDAIKEGKSGFLINHNDIKEMRRTIERIVRMSALERFRLGKNAKEKVKKEYTWPAIAKKLYRQYLEVLR